MNVNGRAKRRKKAIGLYRSSNELLVDDARRDLHRYSINIAFMIARFRSLFTKSQSVLVGLYSYSVKRSLFRGIPLAPVR